MSGFPHVISVEETEKVGYSFVLKEDNFVAGDIVLWDGEKKVVADPSGFSLPASGYTPIGIIVIPASHMDDGKARMMSLKWMNCDEPENGNINRQTMVWGVASDLSGLTNFTQIPIIARYDDSSTIELTVPQKVYATSEYGFLPSDYPSWNGKINPEDEGTRWYKIGTYWTQNELGELVFQANNLYAPSPYASDGTPNPLYRAMEYSGGSINNALSYFDGKHQTDVILEARGAKDYETWKPDAHTPEDFPAASCCDMYHTVGTSQGDWYLPSVAEMGYLTAKLNKIVASASKINVPSYIITTWMWSSTIFDVNYAFHSNTTNGVINRSTVKRISRLPVIAFTTV